MTEPTRETPVPSPNPGDACFFCGPDNPIGPRLSFSQVDGPHKELICRWTPPGDYRGLGDILHGGIQSGLMDEIMGWTSLHFSGKCGVTRGFEVRFLSPIYVEEALTLRCRVLEEADNRYDLRAWIENSKGRTCAEAIGSYILVSKERFKRLTTKG